MITSISFTSLVVKSKHSECQKLKLTQSSTELCCIKTAGKISFFIIDKNDTQVFISLGTKHSCVMQPRNTDVDNKMVNDEESHQV